MNPQHFPKRKPDKAIETQSAWLEDVKLEFDCLSILMVNPASYFQTEGLKREWFYRESRREIFRSIATVYDDVGHISDTDLLYSKIEHDLLDRNVMQLLFSSFGDMTPEEGRLKLRKVRDRFFAKNTPYEERFYRLKMMYVRRRVFQMSKSLQHVMNGTEVVPTATDVKTECEDFIKKVGALLVSGPQNNMTDVMVGWLEEKKRIIAGDSDAVRTQTGVHPFDVLTGGVTTGRIVFIAAITKHGKSRVTTRIAYNLVAQKGWVCELFSVEMTPKTVADMLAACHLDCSTADVNWDPKKGPSERWRDAEQFEGEIDRAARDLGAMDFTIHAGKRDIRDIESVVRARAASIQGRRLIVVIDYVQEYNSRDVRGDGKTAVVADVSSRLAALSKELNILVMACAQFNRDAAKGGEVPKFHQLGSSSQIEKDADELIVFHRPGMTKQSPSASDLEPGIFDLALNRHGNPDQVMSRTDVGSLKFGPMEWTA